MRVRTDVTGYWINSGLTAVRPDPRDLFDLDYSRRNIRLDIDEVIKWFRAYMEFSVGQAPSHKEFLQNMEAKENDPGFIGDMEGLLLMPGIQYDQEVAFKWLKEEIIQRM